MLEQSDFSEHDRMCERVSPKLAAVVDGSLILSRQEQNHVHSCLQCQAELVRYRKLLRALHDLRTQVIRPAPGLLADILHTVGEKGERHAIRSLLSGRRTAYIGGVAIATVAGVTGAILVSNHTRKGSKKAA